jgi:aminoglycoside phosphotransferase (APT) family kinase protein
VRQFKGGQSNPTYQLVTPAKKYVLRRKPPGKLLPSAHAVDREFKVISGLNKANFPVAKAYALCMDEDVIGTIFYVMDNVEGRILWDGTLPDYQPAERRAIYEAEIDTLAALHNVDYAAVAWPTTASRATTSPARSTAGPSSTRPARPRTWPT